VKLQAIIISICIIAYTTEQIKIPLTIGSNHSKMMCCKAKMKCHKKMSNKPANSCDGNNCMNCPLGNIFTLQSINNTSIIIPQFKKEFIPLKTTLVLGVNWQVWRPPIVS
jgi:hypothetical protein